mmetsp:Transcript_2215/g.9407  ORF Transcript_2215/g.9407 Transcript_2215/m.9407 type:complete len:387 (+) Transcript_2215:325-1485(+)
MREEDQGGEARDALRALRQRRRVAEARLRVRPEGAVRRWFGRRHRAHLRQGRERRGVHRALRAAVPSLRHHRRHGRLGGKQRVDVRQASREVRQAQVQGWQRRRRVRGAAQVQPHPPLRQRPGAHARRLAALHLRRILRGQGGIAALAQRLRRAKVLQGGSLQARGREAASAVQVGGHRPTAKRQQRARRPPGHQRMERAHLRTQAVGAVPAKRGPDQTGLEAEGHRSGRRVGDLVPTDVPEDPRQGVDRGARFPKADGLRAEARGDHVRSRRVVARGVEPRPHGGGDSKRGDHRALPQGLEDDEARAAEDERAVAQEAANGAPGSRGGGGRPAVALRAERRGKDEFVVELELERGELGHGAGHGPGVRGRQRRGDEAQQAVPRRG